MSTSTEARLTPKDYLRLERLADRKSEFFDGEVIPMPGVTREHNVINGNLVFELKNQLASRPCDVYVCDMKVKVPVTGSYAYPDVAALCGESLFEHGEAGILLNPQLLIEVLSESTERHDRGLKLRHYRSIESLREYLLVSQAEYRVERYARHAAGDWLYSDVTDPEGVIDISSIACRLSLARIYDRVFLEG